ncbi:MAG TPA: metallophosphoesterase [Oscillospiraceae bacterium]|nr:metallophosphoesterase [Oscillospiraceae bacterium]
MSLFAIADLHLSLGCNKPMDVFTGWQNYTEKLEKNWRSIVSSNDTVVIAGDISWAMKLEESEKDFAFLHSLPGKKLILKGNHDYWWTTKKKIDTFLSEHGFTSIQIVHNNAYVVDNLAVCGTRGWLYNAESDEDLKIVNREVGRLNASLDDAKRQGAKPIVFLHYPPVYDNLQCSEILNVLESRQIDTCYFGHIHGSEAAKRAIVGEYHGIKMHLISCDYVNFMPILVR